MPRDRKQRSGKRPAHKRAQKYVVNNFRRYPAPIQVQPRQGIMIQLRTAITLSTDGSGNIAAVLPSSPSGSLGTAFGSVTYFSEWGDWSPLFAAVKVVQTEIVGKSIYVETKGDTPGSIVVASQMISNSAPSSYPTSSDNADSQLWNVTNDVSGRGIYHSQRFKRGLEPAVTSNPFPVNTQYIGCPGAIAFYATGLPVSTALATILVSNTYILYARS